MLYEIEKDYIELQKNTDDVLKDFLPRLSKVKVMDDVANHKGKFEKLETLAKDEYQTLQDVMLYEKDVKKFM